MAQRSNSARNSAREAGSTVRAGRVVGRPFAPGHDPRRAKGQKGVGGPVPSELRERLRGSLKERIGIVETIADDSDASDADRLRALEFLAKHGLSDADNADATTERVVRVVREIVRRTVVED